MFRKQRKPTFPFPSFICVIIDVVLWNVHTPGSVMITFTVSNVSQSIKRQHVFLFPLVLPSSLSLFFQLAFTWRVLPPFPFCLGPNECGPFCLHFSTLYLAPLFEALLLPGFELPCEFYHAQCLCPELRLVWNCQSHRPHFNTGFLYPVLCRKPVNGLDIFKHT